MGRQLAHVQVHHSVTVQSYKVNLFEKSTKPLLYHIDRHYPARQPAAWLYRYS